MLTYEQTEAIAISNTVPSGKVYFSADAGDFYIFTIVSKNTPIEYKGLMTGSTFTAVDKDDGRVWTISITDKRLKNVKKIKGPTKKLKV